MCRYFSRFQLKKIGTEKQKLHGDRKRSEKQDICRFKVYSVDKVILYQGLKYSRCNNCQNIIQCASIQ